MATRSATMPARPATELGQRRRALRALCSKDWSEVRSAAAVAGVIYVVLPLLWTLIYAMVTPKHEILAGVSSILLFYTGPIFAMVLAAQGVCRDLGRNSGRFLEGLPTTPVAIVRAKARIGLLVLFTALAAAGVSDATLARFDFTSDLQNLLGHWYQNWLPALVCVPGAFVLSLVAAVLTRRAVTAVLLAGAAAALIAALPGIWTPALILWTELSDSQAVDRFRWLARDAMALAHPTDMHPAFELALLAIAIGICVAVGVAATLVLFRRTGWLHLTGALLFDAPHMLKLGMLAALAVITWFICMEPVAFAPLTVLYVAAAPMLAYELALWCAWFGVTVAIGQKAVSWALATTLVGVVLISLREVGASVSPEHAISTPSHSRVVSSLHVDPEANIAYFRDASTEYFAELSSKAPRFVPLRRETAGAGLRDAAAWESTLAVSQRGAVYRVFWAQALATTQPGYETPFRLLSLRRLARTDLTWSSPIKLEAPDSMNADGRSYIIDAAASESALALLVFTKRTRKSEYRWPNFNASLAVYDLRDPERPTLKMDAMIGVASFLSQPTPWGWRFERRYDGREVLRGATEQIDFDRAITQTAAWHHSGDPLQSEGAIQIADRHWMLTARTKLAVIESDEAVTSGQTSPQHYVWHTQQLSPLSWLTRSEHPRLLLAGAKHVWEVHSSHAVCYDVSDPRRPRRVAHANTPAILDAATTDDFLVLLHENCLTTYRTPK